MVVKRLATTPVMTAATVFKFSLWVGELSHSASEAFVQNYGMENMKILIGCFGYESVESQILKGWIIFKDWIVNGTFPLGKNSAHVHNSKTCRLLVGSTP